MQNSIIMSIRKLIFPLFVSLILVSCAMANQGYEIKVKVNGIHDTLSYLAYHYGNRQYIQDTVRVDSQGQFVFQGPERLEPGMYLIVLPGQKYFEIIVDQTQHFSVETQMDDFVNTMRFRQSPDNQVFYTYMRLIRDLNQKATPWRTTLQDPETTEARKEEIRKELQQLDQQVKTIQQDIIRDHPGSLFSKILLAQQEPELPEAPLKADGTPDHEFLYHIYKRNFWEHIDFSDDRLVRTPVLHAKLNQYFNQVVIQIPDSIIAEADRIIQKARQHKEVFKYTLFFITNTFERSNIMGMDAVFVHMVENYYMTGEADWVNPEQLERLSERAMALKPLLIGQTAPDITMYKPDQSTIRLHEVKARYTILYFWDSECSHCKRQTPVLRELHARMKAEGVEVFAVNTEGDRNKWLGYVEQNRLNWINVNDVANRSGFRDKYDIWSTPLIFLLDKDKKIMGKRLTAEQTEDFIRHDMENNR